MANKIRYYHNGVAGPWQDTPEPQRSATGNANEDSQIADTEKSESDVSGDAVRANQSTDAQNKY